MKEITLTVIFEGTIYSIDQRLSHLHQALNDSEGRRISSKTDLGNPITDTHLKMGFDGCGVEHGVQGQLFGTGVEEQAKQVEEVVKDLIRKGYKVKLNTIGLSRGGISAIILAKSLGLIDTFHLETNMLLLDPVPGNLSYTPNLDFFGYSLTSKAYDLSASKNLKSVDALYPYQEVGEDTGNTSEKVVAYFQIPIRPTYPNDCRVREEVILGTHLRAFQDMDKKSDAPYEMFGVDLVPIVRKLSKTIIYQFLNRFGSVVPQQGAIDTTEIAKEFEKDRKKWSDILLQIIASIKPKARKLHSLDESQITVTNKAKFLNKTHRELVEPDNQKPEDLCLKVVPDRVFVKRNQTHLTTDDLLAFLKDFENELIFENVNDKRIQLLKHIKSNLQEAYYDEEHLSFLLRDIVALALQKKTSTTWGGFFSNSLCYCDSFLELVNLEIHKTVHNVIHNEEARITPQMLREYVLARDDINYFKEGHADITLAQVEMHKPGEDGFRLFL